MTEIQNHERKIISEEILLARLAQSEQMRAYFIEVWKQNPGLAKQGGERVKNLMTPLESVDSEIGFSKPAAVQGRPKLRGASLIELIMFIVIISAALIGILSVMNFTTKNSADPLIHKQAIAVAESLLEEIELQDFIAASGVAHTMITTPSDRTTGYHVVSDYDGFNMIGITLLDGSNPPGLASYSAKVSVSKVALDIIPATSAVQISVVVTDPSNNTIQIDGYRTAY